MLAHGLRGQKQSKGTSSGVAVGDVGERGAPWAATGGLGIGTTWPGHRARAAGTVANWGRVCLRAKKSGSRTGGHSATA